MQVLAIFALCVVGALTAPNGYGAPALLKVDNFGSYAHAPLLKTHVPIVKFLKNDDNYGNYNFDVQTGDGISQIETGNLKNVGGPESDGPVNVKEGSYSWTSPEGQFFEVRYVSDEHGFRASGAHLPTPPPIPQEILKSLTIPRVAEIGYGGYAVPAIRLGGY